MAADYRQRQLEFLQRSGRQIPEMARSIEKGGKEANWVLGRRKFRYGRIVQLMLVAKDVDEINWPTYPPPGQKWR